MVSAVNVVFEAAHLRASDCHEPWRYVQPLRKELYDRLVEVALCRIDRAGLSWPVDPYGVLRLDAVRGHRSSSRQRKDHTASHPIVRLPVAYRPLSAY
jgi:hypothetical protein